ncbi:8914_t:CDS:10 [Ambispora gerdemannii]|uniref:8914_t:CDS:1 n=1 Tax=Ambispora gerdemannii TaxID=144530 RepID=A0A9N9AZR7_9GLOM|nr:8914_t:CDS:10 [Ambispora gerdemannii]
MRGFPKTPTTESSRNSSTTTTNTSAAPTLGGSSNVMANMANPATATSITTTTNPNTIGTANHISAGVVNNSNANVNGVASTTNTFSWSSVAAANSNNTVSSRTLHNEPSEKTDVPGGAESALSPFKYSKEFMLKFYKPVGLPLEFERHEYVTSDEPLPPMALLSYTEQEQKLLSGASVNSDLTRRIVSNVNVATATTASERTVDRGPFSPRGDKPSSTGLTSPRTERREGSISSVSRRDGEKDEDNKEAQIARPNRTLRTASLSIHPPTLTDDLMWNGVNRHAVGTFDSHGVFRIPGSSGNSSITNNETLPNGKLKENHSRNEVNEQNPSTEPPETRTDEKSDTDRDVLLHGEPAPIYNGESIEHGNDSELSSDERSQSSIEIIQPEPPEQEQNKEKDQGINQRTENEHSSSLLTNQLENSENMKESSNQKPEAVSELRKSASPVKDEFKISSILEKSQQAPSSELQSLLQSNSQTQLLLQQQQNILLQQQQQQQLLLQQHQPHQQLLQEQQQFVHQSQQHQPNQHSQQHHHQKQHLLQQQLLLPPRSPIAAQSFDSDQDDDVLKAAFSYSGLGGTTPPFSPGVLASKFSINNAFADTSAGSNSLFSNIDSRKSSSESEWLYRDPAGKIQGPFSSQEMNDWFKGGFFTGSLMVKRVDDPSFEPLANLIRKTGDEEKPFSAPLLSGRPPLTIAMPPTTSGRLVNDPFQRGWGAPSSPSTAQLFLDQQRFNPFGGTTSVPTTPFDRYQFGSVFGNRTSEISNGWNDLNTATTNSNNNSTWPTSETFTPTTGNLSPRLQNPSSPLFSSTSAFGIPQTHNYMEHQRALNSQIERFGAISGPISAPISNTPTALIDVISRAAAAPWNATSEQQTPSSPWNPIVTPNVAPTPSRVSTTQHEEVGYFGTRKDLNFGLNTQPIQFESSSPLHQSNETPQFETSGAQTQESELEIKVNNTAEAIAKVVLADEEPSTNKHIKEQTVEEKKQSADEPTITTKVNVVQETPITSKKEESSNKSRPSLREIQADEERKKQQEEREKSQKSANLAWGGVIPTSTLSSPWATKDDENGSHKAPSLREIQEMEARKAAERKAVERINTANFVAQSAAVSNTTKDEIAAINTSWGMMLPNSSTATNTTTAASNSSSLSSSPIVTAAPAWHSNNVGPKKTLREIQKEEEEAMKKRHRMREMQQQASLNAAAAGNPTVSSGLGKRYADTLVAGGVTVGGVKKPALPPAIGSAWTTVAAGKPGAASRVSTGTNPSFNVNSNTNIAASNVLKLGNLSKESSFAWDVEAIKNNISGLQNAQRTQIQTNQNAPRPPSEEFMKWCRNILRPLNNNINVDDFIQMLFTFPLDPPPNTLEIIQESVYEYSTNLDGRRFADEFVKRRKADAAGISMSSYSSYHGEGKLGKDVGTNNSVVGVKEDTSSSTNAFKVVTAKKGKKKH